MIALKIDAKIEGKLPCIFKNDVRNLENFHRLKTSDFILESKMVESNQNKKFKTTKSIRCSVKTFYTFSKESLFLRYKKISKIVVKLGRFLQCSVHIFLEHDGWFWKFVLKTLWNHIMKNFQVKHGQCDIILPKSWVLYLGQVLESIYNFIIEHHVLQCLFVRGSNKKQTRGRIISIFTKGKTFSSLMTTKCFCW